MIEMFEPMGLGCVADGQGPRHRGTISYAARLFALESARLLLVAVLRVDRETEASVFEYERSAL